MACRDIGECARGRFGPHLYTLLDRISLSAPLSAILLCCGRGAVSHFVVIQPYADSAPSQGAATCSRLASLARSLASPPLTPSGEPEEPVSPMSPNSNLSMSYPPNTPLEPYDPYMMHANPHSHPQQLQVHLDPVPRPHTSSHPRAVTTPHPLPLSPIPTTYAIPPSSAGSATSAPPTTAYYDSNAMPPPPPRRYPGSVDYRPAVEFYPPPLLNQSSYNRPLTGDSIYSRPLTAGSAHSPTSPYPTDTKFFSPPSAEYYNSTGQGYWPRAPQHAGAAPPSSAGSNGDWAPPVSSGSSSQDWGTGVQAHDLSGGWGRPAR